MLVSFSIGLLAIVAGSIVLSSDQGAGLQSAGSSSYVANSGGGTASLNRSISYITEKGENIKKRLDDHSGYLRAPKQLRGRIDYFMRMEAKPLDQETDPSIKVCKFDAGNDNGITASCLNAFIHLNIDNDCNSPFFKKLIEKLHIEQKSVTENSNLVNPHDVIRAVFNELGDNIALQNVANNDRDTLKKCLLKGGNSPFEFMTALYKICGVEKDEKFSRSVIKKQTGDKKWNSPCLQLTPAINPLSIEGNGTRWCVKDLVEYQDVEQVFWDTRGLKQEVKLKSQYSINFPSKYLCLSLDKILPISCLNRVGLIHDYHFDNFGLDGSSDWDLKALICCNITKDEIIEGKLLGSLQNRKFSCILNKHDYNEQISRLIVLDSAYGNMVLSKKSIDDNPFTDMKSCLTIDKNNYRVPVMAFYERASEDHRSSWEEMGYK